MLCPHCRVAVHEEYNQRPIGLDEDGGWFLSWMMCPECSKIICYLLNGSPIRDTNNNLVNLNNPRAILVRPRRSQRPPCPSEVPADYTDDYNEACLILEDSPKASAALTRRCLQAILRDVAKVKPGNLADEIQEVLDKNMLPGYLTEQVDAVRNIGNFAAHPMKSKSSGEILPVEPGEAEWNLNILESLFEFYFVQPAAIQKKRSALDKKLKSAGKKPMK